MVNNTIGYCAWLFFIGGVIGWSAGSITRDREFGIIGDIVIGIVGIALSGWIAGVI